MARRAASADPAPVRQGSGQAKCSHCRGMGFEPDTFPLAACTLCGGSGRPAPAATNQEELIDG